MIIEEVRSPASEAWFPPDKQVELCGDCRVTFTATILQSFNVSDVDASASTIN